VQVAELRPSLDVRHDLHMANAGARAIRDIRRVHLHGVVGAVSHVLLVEGAGAAVAEVSPMPKAEARAESGAASPADVDELPAAVAPRRLFDLATIAWALARWLHDGASSRSVRTQVSPLPFVGDSARRAWCQLRRWARRAAEILRPPRPVRQDASVAGARAVLDIVGACAPLSLA